MFFFLFSPKKSNNMDECLNEQNNDTILIYLSRNTSKFSSINDYIICGKCNFSDVLILFVFTDFFTSSNLLVSQVKNFLRFVLSFCFKIIVYA
ncbi:hypothetical protein KSF78_0003701 [Schistosoma japonicum]|nr:hypothetical protein KSF78_0003701 [Schistosoma japonicum]